MKKALLISVVLMSFIVPAFGFTEEEADTFANQAYQKALEAVKNQDIEIASMYFINAMSFKPGSIEIITDYVSYVLDIAKADSSLSNDTLNALDSFLNAQVMTVKPDDIQKIIGLRAKVSEARESILKNLADSKESTPNKDNAELVLNMHKEAVRKAKTLDEYIAALNAAHEVTDYYDIADTETAERLQNAMMLHSVIQRINELIDSSKAKGLEPMQTYYLQLAENSLQQAALLSASMPLEIRKSLLPVKTAVENRVNEVSEARSSVALRNIKDDYGKVLYEVNKLRTQQKKIERLNDFLQSISFKAQAITSEKYAQELRDITAKIQSQILKCRNDQETEYSKWAFKRMNRMTAQADKHDRTLYKGKFRNTDAMCNVMINYLSDIDTRLLNFGAQHCFSRVYEEYYQKLDAENQKRLDESIAYNTKQGLNDF